MKRLWSIGEALIDFLPLQKSFVPVVGGAPANVAACYAKLGGKSFFVGKSSLDTFGDMIQNELEKAAVNTDFLFRTKDANTGLCFVSLKPDGEREFMLYRNVSADMLLNKEEIKDISFGKDDILQFGSVDLVDMPVKYATDFLIEKAKKQGALLCFDPNVRKNTWNDLDAYKKVIKEYIKLSDIIKISDEDCEFIFDDMPLDKVVEGLSKSVKLILLTKGRHGSMLYSEGISLYQQAYNIECVDTTGAGDSFLGTFLRYATLFDMSTYKTALKKAAAAAAMVCKKKGVMTALPNEKQLNKFLCSY